MKFLKKLLYLEPLIIVLRYLKTLTLKSVIFTIITPIIVCVILGVQSLRGYVLLKIDLISICSILIGFSSSILIMLFTMGGKTTSSLRNAKLHRNKKDKNKEDMSLFEALVYKFAFITIILIILIIIEIVGRSFSFDTCIIYVLITLFLLLNALLILMESITNTIFCLIKNNSSANDKDQANEPKE